MNSFVCFFESLMNDLLTQNLKACYVLSTALGQWAKQTQIFYFIGFCVLKVWRIKDLYISNAERKRWHSPASEEDGVSTANFLEVPDILLHGPLFPLLSHKPSCSQSSSAVLLPSIWSWRDSLYKLFVIKFQNICPGLYSGPDRSTNSCFSQSVQGGEDRGEIH